MDQELLMKQIVEQVMSAMGSTGATSNPMAYTSGGKVTSAQYPLAENLAEKINTPTGKSFNSLSMDKIISGDLKAADMAIAPETLEMQAQVAESVGRETFATNLRRAAELIAVPDDRLLEIYNAMRPYRSTKQELLDIAAELDGYKATTSATLVREAAESYEKRGRLKRAD